MISSMFSAACTAWRKNSLSVGGFCTLGTVIWIHQFGSGSRVMSLLPFSSAREFAGTSSTACNSPVRSPATRAPGSVTMRMVTVSRQACR